MAERQGREQGPTHPLDCKWKIEDEAEANARVVTDGTVEHDPGGRLICYVSWSRQNQAPGADPPTNTAAHHIVDLHNEWVDEELLNEGPA